MLTIKLFGPTCVETDTRTITAADLGGVKPRQILELLALSAGTPIPKDRLADLLWDGHPPKTYVGTLESYICVLRRSLGLTKGRRSMLATTSHGYVLDPGQVAVDLTEFRRLLAASATAAPEEAVRLTERALAMASSTLLASEGYTAWADAERDCIQQELVTACVRASRHAASLGYVDAAERLAREALDREPYAESAAQQLMVALWRSGRRCEALRIFGALRSAMVADRGVEPGTQTHALYMQILNDEPVSKIGPAGTEKSELKALLGLLRQTLESIPGVELPRTDSALAEIAVQVLEVA